MVFREREREREGRDCSSYSGGFLGRGGLFFSEGQESRVKDRGGRGRESQVGG